MLNIKYIFATMMLAMTSLLTGCTDSPEIMRKGVDVNFYNYVRSFYPENCTRIQGRHADDMYCRLILNKDDTQVRFQIELNYNQQVRFKEMMNAAFLSYVEDSIVKTNEKIKNCESKYSTRLIFCGDEKIDIDKLYWSIFNPVYVKEVYGCDLKNNIFDKNQTIMCDGKKLSKVELSIGSFFDASRGLMLTDNEKNIWSDIFMKKEMSETDYEVLNKTFKIKVLN